MLTHVVAITVEVLCKYCITAFGCNFTPHSTSLVASVDFVCYFECYSNLNHATGKEWILLNAVHNFCAIGEVQIICIPTYWPGIYLNENIEVITIYSR